ncbi:MAG: host-nuclease inhibitor Gam family protein [Ramlibacter sp.]|nr:host-nuclease inhibitor Gam family protein [Ramlibacter sp.]
MTTIEAITKRAEVYASLRSLLADKVNALEDAIAALRKDHLPDIRRAVARAADAEAQLRALVEQNPDLFEKPRTHTVAGVKVGYAKGKGSISFDDGAAVVARIKRVMPEQAELLINTTEAPNKAALAGLSVADLKRLGCSVVEAGDQVIVKPVDSEVDKLVTALLKGASEEAA